MQLLLLLHMQLLLLLLLQTHVGVGAVVQDDDVIAAMLQKLQYGVRAHIAGPAGDQDCLLRIRHLQVSSYGISSAYSMSSKICD